MHAQRGMSTSRFVATAFLVVFGTPSWAQSSADDLARILRDKQVITQAEFDRVAGANGSDAVRQLAVTLRDKGVISGAESAKLTGGPSTAAVAASAPPQPPPAATNGASTEEVTTASHSK